GGVTHHVGVHVKLLQALTGNASPLVDLRVVLASDEEAQGLLTGAVENRHVVAVEDGIEVHQNVSDSSWWVRSNLSQEISASCSRESISSSMSPHASSPWLLRPSHQK